jgi:lipoprotein-anchoring transpeptidase ErfK/SrfK
MASSPSGAGYWLVAADGGIFAFGDAPFLGSHLRTSPDADAVGIAASPDGDGYWVAHLDGRVVAFGVPDLGSAAETDRYWGQAPTIAIAATGADGYLLLHGDPIVFAVQAQGPDVVRLQQRLVDLRYWLGAVDGVFGPLTEQAVIAFQKLSGLPTDGRVDGRTQAALATAIRPATSMTGHGLDVDKTRQVMHLVRDGTAVWTFNISTGTEQPYVFEGERYLADTPVGRFTVERQVDGWRVAPLGRLYRPKFIVGGIAIHGYSNVPVRPASHGCIRVTNAAMDFLWEPGIAPLGSAVWVHGTSPPPSS